MTRATSYKSLGNVEYEGWLLQRREQPGSFLVPSFKWVKRWVVLKQAYLFCFKSPESLKADTLIHLLGFVVAPATECKSKKYGFKLYTLSTVVHFAAETVSDMSKWISKIGFAAITHSAMSKTSAVSEDSYFSQTDDEGSSERDNDSQKHQHHRRHHKNPYSRRDSSRTDSTTTDSTDSSVEDVGNNENDSPSPPPRPLPRVSLTKKPPAVVAVKEKSPVQVSTASPLKQPISQPDILLQEALTPIIAHNHVPPVTHENRIKTSVDPGIFTQTPTTTTASNSKVSVLDREYNRLFGHKSPQELNRSLPPRNVSDSDVRKGIGQQGVHPKRHSTSSSSTGQQKAEEIKYVHQQQPSLPSIILPDDTASTSCHSPSSSSQVFMSSSHSLADEVFNPNSCQDLNQGKLLPKDGADSKGDKESSTATVTKSSSFRTFLQSPKLLKKFTSPKHQREKKTSKAAKDSKDSTSSNDVSSGFASSSASVSPKVSRKAAFFASFARKGMTEMSRLHVLLDILYFGATLST